MQALSFLPGKVVIDEGDSITWNNAGEPHTITFLGSYAAPPANPTAPQGGNTFDGSNFVSSGFLLPGQKFTLTFTKAGTYPYFCVLHAPEMNGVVVVQPRGTPYPQSQTFYTLTGHIEELDLIAQAQASVLRLPFEGGTTIAAGTSGPAQRDGDPSKSTVLAFLNSDRLNSTSITVPVGTTVTWRNLSNNEPHTVTFPVVGQPLPPAYQNPFAPPAGGSTYDGSAIANSGALIRAIYSNSRLPNPERIRTSAYFTTSKTWRERSSSNKRSFYRRHTEKRSQLAGVFFGRHR